MSDYYMSYKGCLQNTRCLFVLMGSGVITEQNDGKEYNKDIIIFMILSYWTNS